MQYGPPPLFRQGVSARVRFIFFVVLSLVAILVDGRLRALEGLRSAIISFTSPIERVVSLPSKLIGEGENYFTSKSKLAAENRRLTEENQLLQLKAARLDEMTHENERLRALVNAVPRSFSQVVTAEVIGRVADPFTNRIQINVGEIEGLQTGMPVIGAFGALGQISRVVAHAAEVTLLTDHRQQIAVMNERTGALFIASGTGDGLLDVLFVLPKADIKLGDRLVTSGLDHLFPRNILVGTVDAINYQPGETYQRISAVPSVDTADIQFATVVLTNPIPAASLDEENAKSPLERRRRPRKE